MKSYRIFDIVGPRMIGPSSSHTAGAARIGKVAYSLAGGNVKKAHVTLYDSFATTGEGHGTDKALAGGLLGMEPDDERLKYSFRLAEEQGVEITFETSTKEAKHPNTARIVVEGENGNKAELVGVSVGGGNIEIQEINGMEVSFNCKYPTTLTFHHDLPGVISRVTATMAREGINIAFMKVFRTSKQQQACMVIETDGIVPSEIIETIRKENPEIWEICSL